MPPRPAPNLKARSKPKPRPVAKAVKPKAKSYKPAPKAAPVQVKGLRTTGFKSGGAKGKTSFSPKSTSRAGSRLGTGTRTPAPKPVYKKVPLKKASTRSSALKSSRAKAAPVKMPSSLRTKGFRSGGVPAKTSFGPKNIRRPGTRLGTNTPKPVPKKGGTPNFGKLRVPVNTKSGAKVGRRESTFGPKSGGKAGTRFGTNVAKPVPKVMPKAPQKAKPKALGPATFGPKPSNRQGTRFGVNLPPPRPSTPSKVKAPIKAPVKASGVKVSKPKLAKGSLDHLNVGLQNRVNALKLSQQAAQKRLAKSPASKFDSTNPPSNSPWVKGTATSFWDTGSSGYGDTGAPASGSPMQRHMVAHPYLPMGTKLNVRVGNKTVPAFVGDKGPGKGGNLIDLSVPMAAYLYGRGAHQARIGTKDPVEYQITGWGTGSTLYPNHPTAKAYASQYGSLPKVAAPKGVVDWSSFGDALDVWGGGAKSKYSGAAASKLGAMLPPSGGGLASRPMLGGGLSPSPAPGVKKLVPKRLPQQMGGGLASKPRPLPISPQQSAPLTGQPAQPGMSAREQVLEAAKSQLGVPYVWGGGGGLSRNRTGKTTGIADSKLHANAAWQKGFDCSGLVDYAFSKIGKKVGYTTREQAPWAGKNGKVVPMSKLRPGDLVFAGGSVKSPKGVHHVAIYWGDGKIIEAQKTGTNIKISDWRPGLWGVSVNY